MKRIEKIAQLCNKYHAMYKAENYTHWDFMDYLKHLSRCNREDRTDILRVIAWEQYIDNLLYDLKTA
jgi:hypothetical protein